MELQKALEEASDLQGKIASAQSKVSSLREQLDKEHAKKLALKHNVRVIRNNLVNRDKDLEKLRAEASRQSERYDDLWKAHGVLLEEV